VNGFLGEWRLVLDRANGRKMMRNSNNRRCSKAKVTPEETAKWANYWFGRLRDFHKVGSQPDWLFTEPQVIAFLRGLLAQDVPTWKRLKAVENLCWYRDHVLQIDKPKLDFVLGKLSSTVQSLDFSPQPARLVGEQDSQLNVYSREPSPFPHPAAFGGRMREMGSGVAFVLAAKLLHAWLKESVPLRNSILSIVYRPSRRRSWASPSKVAPSKLTPSARTGNENHQRFQKVDAFRSGTTSKAIGVELGTVELETWLVQRDVAARWRILMLGL